jgi:type IV pilus assembly protein PilY1
MRLFPTFFRIASRRRAALAGGLAGTAVLLTAGLAISAAMDPPPRAACCTGPLAMGDAMLQPPSGADKAFFEAQTTPPAAIFLLGNNASMQDFHTPLPEPEALPDVTGCEAPALRSGMSWFDLQSSDPRLNGSRVFDPDAALGAGRGFFDPDRYYLSFGTRLPLQRLNNGDNAGDSTTHYTVLSGFGGTEGRARADEACSRYWPRNAAMQAACAACLRTVGWYRGDTDGGGRRRWVLSGRVLNVRPPKFVTARKVLKDVINTVPELRMGVVTFSHSDDLFDPAELLRPLRPTCEKSWPVFSEEDLDRPALVAAVNRVRFTNSERSIGESLYSLGAYFSSQRQDNRWAGWFTNPLGATAGYPGGPDGTRDDADGRGLTWARKTHDFTHLAGDYVYPLPLEGGGDQKSVCAACQASAVIVLSDGRPDNDNTVPVHKMLRLLVEAGAKHPDGTPLTFNPGVDGNPGGVNYCDRYGVTKEACDYFVDTNGDGQDDDTSGPKGGDTHNRNYMDDVAFFLANADLRGDLSGVQSVRTYTIGYGDNSPMLRSMARAGGGQFYRADEPGQLRDALMTAIGDLRETATSFSSASVASVQAGSAQTSAYVPRFIPRQGQPYEGHLYRFYFYGEFAQGCDAGRARTEAGDPLDLNDDGDCDDSFYLDRPAGFTPGAGRVPAPTAFTKNNIVEENVSGAWVKAATARRNAEGRLEGGDAAVPFWDLGETLGRRSASAPCEQLGSPGAPIRETGGRCLFTMVDRDGNGRYDQEDNPPLPFDEAHAEALRPLLLSGGDTFCPDVFSRLDRVWTGSAAEQAECARVVIRLVRGQDVFDADGDRDRDEDRPCAGDSSRSCKLGDIFHSSPILVEPPVEPFLCDLGLAPQCLRTLYADYVQEGTLPTSEPVCGPGTTARPCYRATPMQPPLRIVQGDYGAYGEYLQDQGQRDRFLLVGSNGGMLHAVHAGRAIESRARGSALDDLYDLGTGQELWAFIPPDLLPKLGLLVRGHEYMVDGTPMVRDVWVDGLDDGRVGGDEGERRGDGVKQAEEFRTLAVITERGGGQRYSALDVTDPYGMLRNVAGAAGPFRWMFPQACDPEAARMGQAWMNFAPKPPPIGPVRLRSDREARGWEERWAVFLNGGYSADLTRGRGLYVLDAWTGQKLWTFTDAPLMPVAAAPALVDVGRALDIKADQDGFFDTVVVGDLGGQVWTFRLFEPGDDTSGMVTNWHGARTFEIARGQPEHQKTPFFHIASNTLQPETGWLRTYLGTGDRQHLRDTEGDACGPDNLLACVRMRCDVSLTLAGAVGGVSRTSVLEYTHGVLTRNQDTTTGEPVNVCAAGRLELTRLSIDCNGSALGAGHYRFPPNNGVPSGSRSECTRVGGRWNCESRRLASGGKGHLRLGDADRDQVPRNTYVGFYNYGGTRVFSDAASARALDARRWTDSDDECPTGQGCGLRDVTVPPALLRARRMPDGELRSYVTPEALAAVPRASTTGAGWFLRYGGLDEKTAAGSSILGGIVFWPSFAPPVSVPGACRAAGAGDVGRSWQMDIITGWPDQAESFKLFDDDGNLVGYLPFKSRDVVSPPPEPASVITLSRSGAIRYTTLDTGVGSSPTQETLRENSNPASDISWVEVPRSVHVCRHVDVRACK